MAAAAAATASGDQAKRQHDYSEIGNSNGKACTSIFVSCTSDLKKSLKDPAYNRESLVLHLLDGGWEALSEPVRRFPASPGVPQSGPTFQIQSISKADKISLRKMAKGGYVLAKIIANPLGPEDDRYGIGSENTTSAGVSSPEFFIIAKDFDVSDDTPYEMGRKVATWEIWGIAGKAADRKLVLVGRRTGHVRYCGPAHPTSYKERTAKFLKCTTVDRLYGLRSDVSLTARLLGIPEKDMASIGPEDRRVSLDRIIEAIRTVAGGSGSPSIFGPELLRIRALRDEINDPANPAWMACGLGCCTADIVPGKTAAR